MNFQEAPREYSPELILCCTLQLYYCPEWHLGGGPVAAVGWAGRPAWLERGACWWLGPERPEKVRGGGLRAGCCGGLGRKAGLAEEAWREAGGTWNFFISLFFLRICRNIQWNQNFAKIGLYRGWNDGRVLVPTPTCGLMLSDETAVRGGRVPCLFGDVVSATERQKGPNDLRIKKDPPRLSTTRRADTMLLSSYKKSSKARKRHKQESHAVRCHRLKGVFGRGLNFRF